MNYIITPTPESSFTRSPSPKNWVREELPKLGIYGGICRRRYLISVSFPPSPGRLLKKYKQLWGVGWGMIRPKMKKVGQGC
jgi:hypothetical protein